MNLSMNFHTPDGQPSDVRYSPRPTHPDYEVQIFLGGSSYHTMYMSVEDARTFAQQILAALPVPAEAGA